MEFILLKSSACLLAFIAFYKLFLERTSNHQFKRYYLLITVLISIAIPFITFIEYVEPTFVLGEFTSPIHLPTEETLANETANYIPIALWCIYGLGVLLLSIRFVSNLSQILLKIKRNPKQKRTNFISVLLQDYVVPHTFFSYIFFNKTKFENNEIPDEVLLHEETHAKQKHSLDILFIELLQIIFWFNPLIYILKKDIKLNHEFLADQAVINQGIEPTNYQQLLLEFSSNSSTNQLANAINYSLIKKRFTVMKTKTSKQSLWLRSLLLLPLLAILIFGFSTTKQVEKDVIPKISDKNLASTSNNAATNHTARSITIKVLNNGTYEIDGINATKNNFVAVISELHKDITPEIRNRIMNIHLLSSKEISDEDVWFIYNSVIDYGFHRIVTNNQEIIREKGNTPYAKQNTDITEYSEKDKQDGATKKQVAEYNELALFYNKMFKDGGKMRIKSKDVERLKYLYNLMSKEQRGKAEPFPNFPEPPPAPASIKVVKGERSEIAPPPPPKTPKVIKGERSDIPPPPPPAPKNATPEQKAKYEVHRAKYEEALLIREVEMQKRSKLKKEAMINREQQMLKRNEQMKERESQLIEREKHRELAMKERELAMKEREHEMKKRKSIKEGHPPKSPLDHVIDMSKKGANFYYNDKKITSDQAIKLLKENGSLNISSNTNDGISTVKISTKPITIGN